MTRLASGVAASSVSSIQPLLTPVTPQLPGASEGGRGLLARIPVIIKLFLLVDLAFAVIYPIQERHFGNSHTWAADLFDLDAESNAPTWWSSLQLTTCGLLLAAFAWQVLDRRDKRSWLLIGAPLMFFFLSLDETVMIHEAVGRFLDAKVHLGERQHSLLPETGVWMLFCGPALIAALFVIGSAAKKYFAGRKAIATQFLLGFALLIGAATGVELISNFVGQGMGYVVETLIEETGEMLGETILIWACLNLLASYQIKLIHRSASATDRAT